MVERLTFDEADLRILAALQKDGTLSIAALSETIALSHNSCWRPLKRLEAAGAIKGRVALLDAAKLGLELTAYVSIRTSEHNDGWLADFKRAVAALPEIVELYRMTGDVDYLMKVRVANIEAYDTVYKKLIGMVKLTDVSSAFAMEEMKNTTELPLSTSPLMVAR